MAFKYDDVSNGVEKFNCNRLGAIQLALVGFWVADVVGDAEVTVQVTDMSLRSMSEKGVVIFWLKLTTTLEPAEPLEFGVGLVAD